MAYKYRRGTAHLSGTMTTDDVSYYDDTDTSIDWEPDYISFKTNNTSVLTVSGSSVGIGTASPSSLLHLKGTSEARIRLESSTRTYTIGSDAYGFVIHDTITGGTAGYRFVISDEAASRGYVGIGAGASIAASQHPDALLHLSSSDDGQIFRADTTDGTTVLFATGSNRVGIGTASPAATLHVSSSDNASSFRVDNLQSATKGPALFVTGARGDGAAVQCLGIGTDTPAQALDVNGYITIGSSGGAYVLVNDDSDTYIRFGHAGSDSMQFKAGGLNFLEFDENGLDIARINPDGVDIDFQVATLNNDYTIFTEGSTDRVGIGTSSPAATLHVSSSHEDGVFFQVSAPTWTATAVNPATKAELAGVLLKVTGSGIVFGGTNTYFDYGQVQIGDQSNGYGRLELGTGSVNDGTADLYRLTSWQGDFGIWDCHDGGNQICLNFDNTALTIYGTAEKPGGGSWSNSTSDRRLKENIINLTGSLAKIQQLQGRAYEWRVPEAHDGTTEAAGFIAQEIQEVFPEFVREAKLRNDAEKDLIPSGSALTYGLPDAFTAHLVEAIKEQQVIIEALTARVEQLEISGSQ